MTIFYRILTLCAAGTLAVSCARRGQEEFALRQDIVVVSREDGSGTRGAFIDIFGIERKGADGSRKDMTTSEAIVARLTDVVMATVANNKYAAGYISLGSLNRTVKALAIDGAAASVENVQNGSYPVSRPFYIAAKPDLSDAGRDFRAFMLSAQGQEIVGKSYISIGAGAPYTSGAITGKVVVGGSSSVTPIMEKLREAYLALNPQAEIEIQQSDSSAGLAAAMDGIYDIAMSSRELNAKERTELSPDLLAIDGIAVIVNTQNPLDGLSKDQVRAIFTGTAAAWSDILK
ncbi:MAG: substrate-binding domain-containing protein [Spirochaetaceae bacterium]|jgi:phosphate transport system substrate-binding protein|nr:substrate-binding domain-containing protein [Spirochaetaceae bacterium]